MSVPLCKHSIEPFQWNKKWWLQVHSTGQWEHPCDQKDRRQFFCFIGLHKHGQKLPKPRRHGHREGECHSQSKGAKGEKERGKSLHPQGRGAAAFSVQPALDRIGADGTQRPERLGTGALMPFQRTSLPRSASKGTLDVLCDTKAHCTTAAPPP